MKNIVIDSLRKFGFGLLYGFFIFSIVINISNVIQASINIKNTAWYILPYNIIYIFVYIYLLKKIWNRNTPKDRSALHYLIQKEIKKRGANCSLNHIDVSKVKNMSNLFMGSEFIGDISKWDTSNVSIMDGMFWDSKFNGDISKWDTSNVVSMGFMFNHSEFNGDISQWNVSKVINMRHMFHRSKFNGDISKWDVSSVENMMFMFTQSKINADLSNWNVISLKNLDSLFYDSMFKWYSDEEAQYHVIDDDPDKPLLPLPYWAIYENKEERDKAVFEYLNKKD